MTHDTDDRSGYRHMGLLRTTDGDVVPAVAPVLRDVLDGGGRVVLACPDVLATALLAALEPADDVRTVDPGLADTRPAVGVAALTSLVEKELPANGARLALVTAVERPEVGWRMWMQTEALLNHLLDGQPVDHLCLIGPGEADPGDRGRTPEEVVAATHPWLLTDAGVVANPRYRHPADVLTELQSAEVPDPLEATEPALSLIDLDDMRTLRRSVRAALADSALSADAVADFVLAIDEIVANAAEHGIPPVDVRLWCSRERMLCSITDRGIGFDDPLAGYGPAHGDMAVGGMGLWLARRSVDTLMAAPADGSGEGCTVRLVVNA